MTIFSSLLFMDQGCKQSRHTQAWKFVSAGMKGWQYSTDSMKQDVKPWKHTQDLSCWLLGIKPYSNRQIKVSKHATKSLSMLENGQTIYFYARICPKSICTVPEFWHMPGDLQPWQSTQKSCHSPVNWWMHVHFQLMHIRMSVISISSIKLQLKAQHVIQTCSKSHRSHKGWVVCAHWRSAHTSSSCLHNTDNYGQQPNYHQAAEEGCACQPMQCKGKHCMPFADFCLSPTVRNSEQVNTDKHNHVDMNRCTRKWNQNNQGTGRTAAHWHKKHGK